MSQFIRCCKINYWCFRCGIAGAQKTVAPKVEGRIGLRM